MASRNGHHEILALLMGVHFSMTNDDLERDVVERDVVERDVERDEEPWDSPQEDLIRKWRDSSNSLSEAHDKGAHA
eukprot:5030376-Prymnesium_polylepis.1